MSNEPERAVEPIATPQLDKMLAVRDRSQVIGEFLEWLEGQRYTIGKVHHGRNWAGEIVPGHFVTIEVSSIERLLADFFGIDLDAVEGEKQAVLAALREAAS